MCCYLFHVNKKTEALGVVTAQDPTSLLCSKAPALCITLHCRLRVKRKTDAVLREGISVLDTLHVATFLLKCYTLGWLQ